MSTTVYKAKMSASKIEIGGFFLFLIHAAFCLQQYDHATVVDKKNYENGTMCCSTAHSKLMIQWNNLNFNRARKHTQPANNW